MSIHNATIVHKIKTPSNPETKDMLIRWGIKSATKNATMAMLHHGRNMPARKLNTAISNIDKSNLI
jgi:hypothetical protein